jgi:hypothetical protein
MLKVKLKLNLEWLTRLFPIACRGLVGYGKALEAQFGD